MYDVYKLGKRMLQWLVIEALYNQYEVKSLGFYVISSGFVVGSK